MAKLRSISGVRIGFISVEGAEPATKLTDEEVKLAAEFLPFEMEGFTRTGLETALAARSLLWSSRNIGAVLRDKDGLYHAVETNLPRLELGDSHAFAPVAKLKGNFDLVELVVVPKVSYAGHEQPASSSNGCFVDRNARSGQSKTKAGQALEKKIAGAFSAWNAWHQKNVGIRPNPPAPPDEISLPLREILGALLGIAHTEIAVKQKRDELISDKIALDLFNEAVRGRAGSSREDIQDRLDRNKKGDLQVVLQLHAAVFRGPLPSLGILGTCIHEAAHYRHYSLTRQLIDMWHQSPSGKNEKSKPVTEDVFRRKFAQFLDELVRKKQLSNIERLIVHSTFGAVQATHPFAQVNAFTGVHPWYPREFDLAGSKKGRGLVDQARFNQLLKGVDAWRHAQNPSIANLTVSAVADYAKNESDSCIQTDLLDLCKEVIALAGKKQKTKNAEQYFTQLQAELSK